MGTKRTFLLYLLTYSPYLNKIETLWRFINGATTRYQWLKIKDYANLDSLRAAIKNIFRQFGTDYQIKFTMNY